MDSYENISDEVLIVRLRDGCQEIMDVILERYKNLVRKRANAMFLIGGENEDLIQEGMIGLFKAIRDFRTEKESSFYHFADLCISRQIIHAVEAAGRRKHQPLNSYVSLSCQESEEGMDFMDMRNLEQQNPERLMIEQENARAMGRRLRARLSKMEKQVVGYYLQGLNYREIAKLMDRQPKAIDNALQRIRGKLAAESDAGGRGEADDSEK